MINFVIKLEKFLNKHDTTFVIVFVMVFSFLIATMVHLVLDK